ncbi:MAG: hypothetical protein R6V85_18135 [Polyangia bacterium]
MISKTASRAALVACLFLVACGAEGPRAKLKHAAFLFNDGLRWGRWGEVMPRLDPELRGQFSASHSEWGDSVRISDVEMLEIAVDEGLEKALITVQYTWYRVDEMEVRTTSTRQHWESRDGEWIVIAEEHLSGTSF